MGKYLHLFENETQYQQKRDNDYEEPWVSVTEEDDNRVDFNKTEDEKLFETPLTLEITGNGNITLRRIDSNAGNRTVEYTKNNEGTWTSLTISSTTGTSISVTTGDNVQFRGNNAGYSGITFSGTTCQFKLKGNIMSLISSTSFSQITTLSTNGSFCNLFMCCTGLTDASLLKLPATTLVLSSYLNLFSGCTNLIMAPELPATTLGNYSYSGMFAKCVSLIKAPKLPVSAVTYGCYKDMFTGCISLTTAPELPATTLAEYCYESMFTNCTGLTKAPDLPATSGKNNCYAQMFDGCTNLNYIKCMLTQRNNYMTTYWLRGVASTGTFVKSPNISSWPSGTSGIPNGWTVQDA